MLVQVHSDPTSDALNSSAQIVEESKDLFPPASSSGVDSTWSSSSPIPNSLTNYVPHQPEPSSSLCLFSIDWSKLRFFVQSIQVYWDLGIIGIRKLALALTLALLPFANSSASVIVLLVLIMSITLHVAIRPYRLWRDNLLETLLLFVAIFVYLLDTIFLHNSDDERSKSLYQVSQVLWSLGRLFAIGCIVVIMVSSMYKRMKGQTGHSRSTFISAKKQADNWETALLADPIDSVHDNEDRAVDDAS